MTEKERERECVWENGKKMELWIEQTMKNVTETKLTTNTLGFNEHYCWMRRLMISESAKTIYLQHNLHFPRAFRIAFLNLLFNVSKKRLGEEKEEDEQKKVNSTSTWRNLYSSFRRAYLWLGVYVSLVFNFEYFRKWQRKFDVFPFILEFNYEYWSSIF